VLEPCPTPFLLLWEDFITQNLPFLLFSGAQVSAIKLFVLLTSPSPELSATPTGSGPLKE
jgi:hypothetical protein